MNARGNTEVPQTGRHRTIWPGLVWAVPLAALLLVAYLGINAWAHRGEVVTVTFNRAADARPGDTKVLYQGVEAGHLLKIVPNKDGRRLDFVIRLRPEAAAGLNTNARFWLIGASANLTDLSSLRAVVSGVAIGYAPGTGGTPTTRFEGLDKAPTVLPGDRGTRYLLRAHTLGSIREGSVLLFHGQPIGKVTDVQFKGPPGFQVEVFVFQPYDSLVKAGSRFWKVSPLRLSLAGGGVTATLAPASTLLAGGIDLEGPADPNAAKAPAEAEFTLYASRAAARQGLSGPTVRYDFAFPGTGGDLDEDSGVTLLGFQIGEVEAAHLAYDAHTGKPYTAVTALLYPLQLGVEGPAAGSAPDWRGATDAKIRRLLKLGYRARLEQTPALLGNLSIALALSRSAVPAELAEDGPNPRIPSAPGSADVADIAAQADQILVKINQIPIAEIGNDLRDVTQRLKALVSSRQTSEGLAHLNSTLAEMDQLLGAVQPQIGPLIIKLNQAAGQISDAALAAQQLLGSDGSNTDNLPDTIRQLGEAARSIRTLTDYLSRHPEALIRGKRPDS
jgi:paraquat-inducible protein B